MDEIIYDLKPTRKAFSKLGWALTVILVSAFAAQIIMALVIRAISGDTAVLDTSWGMWLGTFAPLYLIAIPLGLLVLRTLPADPPEKEKLGAKKFWMYIPIAYFLTYAGNIVGTVLSMVMSGGSSTNALDSYATDNNPLKIVFTVILAPMIEEFVFRKQIVDRTRRFGEKTAVFLSALAFALFHTNMYQFFYAFLLGWLFAYIYARTGRVRYPIIIHGIINFMGTIVAPAILSLYDAQAISELNTAVLTEEVLAQLAGLLVASLYSMLLMGLAITGLVLVCIKHKELVWHTAPSELPRELQGEAVYINAGMMIYIVVSAALTVYSVLI